LSFEKEIMDQVRPHLDEEEMEAVEELLSCCDYSKRKFLDPAGARSIAELIAKLAQK
jgi:hypothetical protein